MTTGKKDYVDQQLGTTVTRLEELSKTLLLDGLNINPEVEKFLSLREDDLGKMTPAELSIGEYIVSAHSLVIQRKSNRALAIKNWATKCLESIIAKTYKDFEGMMKYEIRRASVSISDEYASRLNEIVRDQEAVIDDLVYLSQSLTHISNSLGNLARIRNKGNY